MCLSVVSVLCCLVEVSATGRSLVQRSPTECVVSECDREAALIKLSIDVKRRCLTVSSIRSNATACW